MPDIDTGSTSTEDTSPAIAYRPRRRKGGATKGTARTGKAATTRPVKLMIPADAYEALVVHGLRRGETLSELVTSLIRTGLNDFVIHAKPGPRSEVGPRSAAG